LIDLSPFECGRFGGKGSGVQIQSPRPTETDLRFLQEKSISNIDRIEILRQKYMEQNGEISKDEFAGFMLTPEFLSFAQEWISPKEMIQSV
jgi:hypothetical protein